MGLVKFSFSLVFDLFVNGTRHGRGEGDEAVGYHHGVFSLHLLHRFGMSLDDHEPHRIAPLVKL